MLVGRKTKYQEDSNSRFICRSNAMFISILPGSPIKIPTQSKVSTNEKEQSSFHFKKKQCTER